MKSVWGIILKVIIILVIAIVGSYLQVVMYTITLLIIRCSATPQSVSLSSEDYHRDHICHRSFSDIGYLFYLTNDSKIHRNRPSEKVGTHYLNHNRHSIGICYEEGLSTDTRTLEQKVSLLTLLRELKRIFPHTLIVGHRFESGE